jgi:hypothetical protein
MSANALRAGMLTLGILAAAASCPLSAGAQPTPGHTEDFTTGLGGFGGGATYSNPGSGGVDGAADGYLRIERLKPLNFGTRSLDPAYTGDYPTAGVTHVRFWLNDVDASQDFTIHFGIGTGLTNFWLHRTGFSPPENSWAEFEVDLTDSTQFVQLREPGGTFTAALSSVGNILFRHDVDPITQDPDDLAGECGIDKIQLLSLSPVESRTWGNIKALFR